jgi:hypothetical protein
MQRVEVLGIISSIKFSGQWTEVQLAVCWIGVLELWRMVSAKLIAAFIDTSGPLSLNWSCQCPIPPVLQAA